MKNKEMKLRRKKGSAEAVSKKHVKAPVRWQSDPSHPATHLAYITDAERELLAKLDMHGSGVSMENPHYGPKGIPSLNGMGGPGLDGRDNGTGGLGPGGRGGTDGYGGRSTGGSSSGRGSTGQGGRGGGLGGDGTGNSGSSGNTGGASSSAGGGRGGGDGGRSGGGRAGGVGTEGVSGGFGGGNNGVGLGVGGLGGGIGGLGFDGGYSGPKGGVIGPSDIGRAISGLAGSNAGRMGLAQASNALAGMRNSVNDVAWGGKGFFGETPSSNVQDKRDQGPLPGIAPGAFGGLAPAGLGGMFAAGAAPSVAQQVSNAATKSNLGQMVNSAAKGDFAPTPTAGAPAISGGAANAGALGGMQNAANVGLSSNVAAKSNMGVPSLNSRSNMAGLIASQGFGPPRDTRSTPMGLSNLSQGQIDNTIAAIAGLPGASFTGLSPTGAFATNSPQAANIARSDAMQGLPSAQGYSQPSMTATPGAMQTPAMSMSPRSRASLAPAMAAINARNAQPAAQAPMSTDLSGEPGAFSNTTDTSGYTDVTDEARNIAQGNYMDAFKGGLDKLGLGNMLSIGGLLSGMGNPNLGNDGTNRGGRENPAIRGLLQAMDPQTPAPEAPDTVRPGNWVPPGLLMRANPFPAVWQNRNPWRGYA